MHFNRIRIARRPLLLWACILALVVALCVISLRRLGRERDDDEASEDPFGAFWAERAYPLGYIPFGARERAMRDFEAMSIRKRLQYSDQYAANASTGAGEPTWHFVGSTVSFRQSCVVPT